MSSVSGVEFPDKCENTYLKLLSQDRSDLHISIINVYKTE